MKPAPFAYARPDSLAAACELLRRHGDNARILAGGQTLIATLNMRLSTPDLLIDIAAVPGLDGISVRGRALRIGARTSHRTIEQSPEVAQLVPLLAQAAPQIGHVAIRNSGTIGGSLAFADPAAEWPACAIALDATIVATSVAGERSIPARAFFRALYDTALAPDEIIVAVEFPILGPGYRSTFLELARRHGDYAIVGTAVVARLARDTLSDVRLAFIGAGPTPMLARSAMAALEGKSAVHTDTAAAEAALAQDLAPIGDLYSSPATKMHLARVLLRRAVAAITAPGATAAHAVPAASP